MSNAILDPQYRITNQASQQTDPTHPAIWTYRTASETTCDKCKRAIARGDWFRLFPGDRRIACWECATGSGREPRGDWDFMSGDVPGYRG